MAKKKVVVARKPETGEKPEKKQSRIEKMKAVCDASLLTVFQEVFKQKTQKVTLLDLTEASLRLYGIEPKAFRAMMANTLVDIHKISAAESGYEE